MCLLCFVLLLTSFSADLFLFVQQSAASLLHACFLQIRILFPIPFSYAFLLVDRRFCVSWSLFGFQIGSVWFNVLLLVIWYFELRCNHLFRLCIHLTSCFDELLQLLLLLEMQCANCAESLLSRALSIPHFGKYKWSLIKMYSHARMQSISHIL